MYPSMHPMYPGGMGPFQSPSRAGNMFGPSSHPGSVASTPSSYWGQPQGQMQDQAQVSVAADSQYSFAAYPMQDQGPHASSSPRVDDEANSHAFTPDAQDTPEYNEEDTEDMDALQQEHPFRSPLPDSHS